jgi:hypothetical protein
VVLARDTWFFERIEHSVVEPRGFLPDGQFFELRVFRHAVLFLSMGSDLVLAIGYFLLVIAE